MIKPLKSGTLTTSNSRENLVMDILLKYVEFVTQAMGNYLLLWAAIITSHYGTLRTNQSLNNLNMNINRVTIS